MKKIFFTSILATIIAFSFVGCSSRYATPEKTVRQFLDASMRKNAELLVNATSDEDGLTTEEFEKRVEFWSMCFNMLSPENEIVSYTIDDVKIAKDGNSAIVEYTLKFKNGRVGSASADLRLINGHWKIYM